MTSDPWTWVPIVAVAVSGWAVAGLMALAAGVRSGWAVARAQRRRAGRHV